MSVAWRPTVPGDSALFEWRTEDLIEWRDASGGGQPEELLALACSAQMRPLMHFVRTAVEHGEGGEEVLAIWGYTKEGAAAWMVCSPAAVTKFAVSLHRLLIPELDLMHQYVGPVAECYCDARNSVHLNWLARMGWKRHGEAVPIGPWGMPAIKFTHEAS